MDKSANTCDTKGCICHDLNRRDTVPNIITAVRTVGAVALAITGLVLSSQLFVLIALAVYWGGDVLDGLSARLLKQETRFGGAFDIVSDRVCCLLIYGGLAYLNNDLILPIVIYLMNFMLIDFLLSLSFLRFDILSPNYFHLVSTQIYRYNFTPIAKFCNSTLFLFSLLLINSIWPAIIVAMISLLVKSISLVHVRKLNPSYSCPATPIQSQNVPG